MISDQAKIFLCGTFRIEDKDGRRLPLQSAKAQALVALVATSPKAERSRPWLQSMLWSDRGADQASGSLRQALTQLRKLLATADISIETDRRRVALDLTTVQIIASGQGEFLEGIDIRDEEFESWLTAERARRSRASDLDNEKQVKPAPSPLWTPASAMEPWSLVIVPQSPELNTARWFEDLFADSLSKSLREVFTAPIWVGPAPATTDWLMVARIQSAVTRPGSMAIRVAIEHPAAQRRVWSGFRDLPSQGVPPIDHPDLQQMVNELIEALGDHLVLMRCEPKFPSEPDKLFRLAMRALFSMEPKRLLQADKLLAQASDIERRGLFLAWRMQLRAIQLIEKHPVDEAATKEEGQHFYARALDLEPNNSMVLATLANSLRRFQRDDAHSMFLAERAVRLNPANSFAWWALSAASSYVGDPKTAYRDARVGRRMAILSQHRFWWDSQVYSSALINGKIGVALKFAEAAHAGNPGFRPPLRYLVALHASEGNFEEALKATAKLQRLEPDFTIERLLKDDSYPASLVHTAPNVNKERIATLI